jgi:hypothetical protein
MAIKVSNTTVIDNSRNLINVASVTLAGNISCLDYEINRPYFSDVAEKNTALGNVITTQDFDVSLSNCFTANLNGNTTFTFSNPPASGRFGSFIVLLRNNHSGNAIVWPTSVRWPGGNASISRTTTSGAYDLWGFYTFDAGTNWFGNALQKDLKV